MLQTDMNVTGHFSKTYHQQELLYMLPLFVRSELTQWFCCLFKAHEMSRCAVGIRVPAVSRTAMSSSSGSISPRWETAMWKGLGTSQMWRKWCGQKDLYKGVSKSFETSSIDCQPMEVHEWVHCAWEQGMLPLSMPSGVAVWTLGVAQHKCLSPRVSAHLRFQHGRETGANSAWNSANLERRLFKWYDVRMEMRPWVEDEAAAKGLPLWQSGGDPAGIAECSWYSSRTGLPARVPAVATALGSMCRCTRGLFWRGCCPNLNQVKTF